MAHPPPPINTGAYPQGHPALGGGAGQPPGYGGGYGQVAPQSTLGQYGGRGAAVEVEGAGRSKAQLIVGIDFVSPTWCFDMADAGQKTKGRGPKADSLDLGNDLFRRRICICYQH